MFDSNRFNIAPRLPGSFLMLTRRGTEKHCPSKKCRTLRTGRSLVPWAVSKRGLELGVVRKNEPGSQIYGLHSCSRPTGLIRSGPAQSPRQVAVACNRAPNQLGNVFPVSKILGFICTVARQVFGRDSEGIEGTKRNVLMPLDSRFNISFERTDNRRSKRSTIMNISKPRPSPPGCYQMTNVERSRSLDWQRAD
jgi:hypothetical protein